MHIKKLEISGFKSFVDKTVVQFDHDIIGIVGPNGCGKSNIVDAIRWCMGEQSAKHLRGRAMEDVIFNGSESRAPAGLSEVTLTFDNTDKGYAETLPIEYRDYAEIAVTRRLFRDGTSEYLINKTPVRLRDITDLFLGTGVGTKAYSIVEQGRIGQIVSSRPQDRRSYIEEAAGITKYKLRRKQAERKLDLTRQNLLRITDIVNEIDRNRGTLKRQAAKAERFVQYRGEHEDLSLHEASHRLLEMIVMEQAEKRFRDAALEQRAEYESRLTGGEAMLESARAEAAGVEQRYDLATQSSATCDQRVTQTTSDAERAQDRLNHLGERNANIATEGGALSLKLEQFSSEQRQLEERLAELVQEEGSLDHDAETEHAVLVQLHDAERSSEQTVSETRMKAATLRTGMATANARIDALVQRQAESDARQQKLAQERALIGTELERTRLKDGAFRAEVELLRGDRDRFSGQATSLEQELSILRPERRETARRVEGLRGELNMKRSRLRVLQDMHERFEGLGAGTKSLLQAADPAVLGIVADRLEVEPRFTTALTSLLGDQLQCVIVSDPSRGLALLEQLRADNGGRASIALGSTTTARASLPAISDARVLSRLIEQVRFHEADAGLVHTLVGGAVVVETSTDAVEVSRELSVIAVSLDGTVASPLGMVTGGSGDNVAAAMVEQKREIRQLTELLSGLESELAAAVEHHADIEHRIAELETNLELSRKTQHERELRYVTAEKDLARVEVEVERFEQRHAQISAEAQELEIRKTALGADLERLQSDLSQLCSEESLVEGLLAAAEQRFSECKTASADQATRVMERKVRMARIREQLEAARGGLQRVLTESELSKARQALLASEVTEVAEQFAETGERLRTATELRGTAEEEALAARQELETVRSMLETVRASLGQHETELRQVRTLLSECDELARQHEMKLHKWGLEKGHLVQNVRERFRGLELPRIVGDYHRRPAPDSEHRRRIDELTKLIDRMGPVNLDAQKEYEDAETRFAELNGQKEDIDKALSELDRAIKQMDRESKRRFKETFDAINELFRSTFTRLFKGGRGELKLTDPEDLLETGVDIIAQPPGKKLGNIELMSGGEKALTATALIFAIFQYRPSPFCILDEVDAPLDEANVTRYNEAIRAMTSNSQFIVITHIKKTMQCVDVLYGVTMGEPGVSRMVSVKINDEAKSRSDRAITPFVAPRALPELEFPEGLADDVQVA